MPLRVTGSFNSSVNGDVKVVVVLADQLPLHLFIHYILFWNGMMIGIIIIYMVMNNNNNNLDIDVLGNGRIVKVFSETDSTISIADSAFSSPYSHIHHYLNNHQYYEDDQAGGTACFQHPNNILEVTIRIGKWWKR